MYRAQDIALSATNILVLMLSLALNIFLVSVNTKEWITSRKCTMSEQIITCMGTGNVLDGALKILGYVFLVLSPYNYVMGETRTIYCFCLFTVISCNLWFRAALCVYSCLKIVKIDNRVYTFLQKHFSVIYRWAFFPTILMSFFVSLPVMLTKEKLWNARAGGVEKNETNYKALDEMLLRSFAAYCSFTFTDLLLCTGSAVAIIISLYRHVKHMEDNAGGFRSPNLQVQVHAIVTVVSILIVNVLVFISANLLIAGIDAFEVNVANLLTDICSTVSTLSLILGNRKLCLKLTSTWTAVLNLCAYPGISTDPVIS